MAKKKVKEYTIKAIKKLLPYEMIIVFKPFLPDKVRSEADSRIDQIIAEAKGEIKVKDIWGKRYLAYEIDGHEEGYYVMYQFEAPGAGMEELNVSLNRHPEILRHLVLRKDSKEREEMQVKVKKTIVS